MIWGKLSLILAVMTLQILLSYGASTDIMTIVLFRTETRCLRCLALRDHEVVKGKSEPKPRLSIGRKQK